MRSPDTRDFHSATMARRALVAVGLVVLFTVLLVWHARHYLPFISHDALISLRYAYRLIRGQGLTWTDGPPVEGYSNLLWILLVAAPGLVGVDLIDAARVIGIAATLVVIGALALPVLRGRGLAETSWAVTLALLFFCLAAPIAVWSIGGLEQPLYGALLAASIALIRRLDEDHAGRPGVWLSVALGLLCLTRPDSAIFCVAAAAAFAIGSRWWRLGIRESLGQGSRLRADR